MNRYRSRLFLVLLIIFFYSCSASKKEIKYPAIDIIGYLKGQLRTLDSIPYGLLKITERSNNLPDSTYLNKESLYKHIAPFMLASIEKNQLEEHYEETSFADATTGYIVINYQAKEKDFPIDQIVVYIKPDNSSIYQIYLNGHLDSKNSEEKKQLLWTHNKGCTIITGIDNDSSGLSTMSERIIWQ